MKALSKNNDALRFGLKETDLEAIIQIFSHYAEIESAIIFGSRAKGNYKNGSDVDIALKGKRLTLEIVSRISVFLNEETTMPYKFDVLNYHSLTNASLQEHIDRVGVVLYKAEHK